MDHKVIFIILACIWKASSLTLTNGNVTLILENANSGISLQLLQAGSVRLTGIIGSGYNFELKKIAPYSIQADADDVNFVVTNRQEAFNIYWQSSNTSFQFQDCFDLKDDRSWFVGREGKYTEWPIQNSKISNEASVVRTENDGSISERYWLSDDGTFLFVNETTPLFVDQNNLFPGKICFIGRIGGPYSGRSEVALNYTVGAGYDAQDAHYNAIVNILGRPTGQPSSEMVRFPLWSTFKTFGDDINDQLLFDFAESIWVKKFRGQVQIEDGWEECYGSLTFKKLKLADIERTLQNIQSYALRIILTVHPFINSDCEDVVSLATENNYLVKSSDGSNVISWWNGNSSYVIDFTNEDAKNWFFQRIKDLLSLYWIDGVKFVAGETSWVPSNPILQGETEMTPNLFTFDYNSIANVTTFASAYSGWRTQWVPAFTSMAEKDSNWSLENGLKAVIVNVMQLNLAGYTMVLPSVIGGSGHASPELFIRWVQAVTFMPVMQFGDLPWEVTSATYDVLEIVQKFVDLHNWYSDKILNVLKRCQSMGRPVNPPVWWIDTSNPQTFTIIDQFLLGEDFLIAPILNEGQVSRDVYLPPGTWEDGNDNTLYEGGRILRDYPAPLDTLPYFMKRDD